MAMAGGPPRGGRRATPGKAALLIELKHRILATLHKLSDRDTQQLAMEELERIAQSLTPEGISLFLTCLYDTDPQQKAVVRRECTRLIGTMASLHGDALAAHLPKMVANVVKRLKDPDSSVRDACVETIGIMAGNIVGGDSISVFLKPLLDALAEQHRTLQTGAALCLARVIECVKEPCPAALQRLSPRVVKMLASQNFLAKASLLNAVGVMVQVPGVVSTSQLPIVLASVQEELENSDWAVRKAAADTLACMATAVGGSLASHKGVVTAALESSRFDKVKPVRDTVCEALQLWKAIYDPSAPQGGTPSGSYNSASSRDSPRVSPRCVEGDGTPSMTDRKSSLLMKSGGSVTSSLSDSSGRPKSLSDRRVNMLKKRTPSLSDKKTNPDFFRKLESVRDSNDWRIEVAVPRDSPQVESPRAYHGNRIDPIPGSTGGMSTPEESNGTYEQEEDGGYQDSKTTMREDNLKEPERWGNDHQDASSWGANASPMNGNDKSTGDIGSIHRHFHSLERQQLSMMEMLQDSMMRVHESMQDLEGRLSRVEQIVDDLAHGSGNAEGRSPVGGSHSFDHSLGKYLSSNGARSQDSMEKMTGSTSEESDEFAFGTTNHQITELGPGLKGVQGIGEIEQLETRRVMDRNAGPQGEGPSARSVWHASKDEAIAAIRGAAIPSKPRNRDFDAVQKQQPGRVVGGPFWMLWSQAMENVRSGDVEVAYAEILGSNDELLLVRLMGRTGPVLEQLSAATVAQLIGRIKQFLQQQSFLDCIIPWIQRVSDLVSSKGPDALGLMEETKKQLVFALQEATSVEYAQSWMGAKIAELAALLSNAWSSSGCSAVD